METNAQDINNLHVDDLDFALPKMDMNIIKVIGVGGGGGNAVCNMFKKGIEKVSFVLCNTDDQALRDTGIPMCIQLGRDLTGGLGAGNRPEVARQAAEESLPEIEAMLRDNTRMVFITAGMGGGTGTGAAPVIAKAAHDMHILTVGIVTIPFKFEGDSKHIQAMKGVVEMSKHVDALLIINNEKLIDIYPDLDLLTAFEKADDVLTRAAKGIAEIITVKGYINLDFADVYTTMKDGGVAIMNTGKGTGEKRVEKAIEDALNSPLLNNSDVYKATKVLFNIYSSQDGPLRMDEMQEINEFMARFHHCKDVIWGATTDETLTGDEMKITLIATGAGMDFVPQELRRQMQTGDQASDGDVNPADDEKEIEKGIDQMVSSFYGGTGKLSRLSYTLADLDNEMILAEVEQKPTYQRH